MSLGSNWNSVYRYLRLYKIQLVLELKPNELELEPLVDSPFYRNFCVVSRSTETLVLTSLKIRTTVSAILTYVVNNNLKD